MKKNIKSIIFLYLVTFNVALNSQNIYSVAGIGTAGYSGDNNSSTLAQISYPSAIAVDNLGAVYVADNGNNRIRKINTNGIITTVAGNGIAGFSGDGGLAISANINYVLGITVDQNSNIYISDNGNNRIRKINSAGIITTLAGTGVPSFSGDGGQSTLAEINSPNGITVDFSGNVFFADTYNYRIRKINTSGIISTIAGNGLNSYSGDGGNAISASFPLPVGVAADANNNIYICGGYIKNVRKINSAGIINPFAGLGTAGLGDNGPAISSMLDIPYGLSVDVLNNIYISDIGNNRIRKVDNLGIITTIAGISSIGGYIGDGGLANLADLNYPKNAISDSQGNIYICDKNNHRIRVICNVNNCVLGENEYTKSKFKFSIFPNPNNGEFNINIEDKFINGDLILINSTGQKIHEQRISEGESKIKTSNLASGLYNFILLQNNGKIGGGKIIIQ